MVIKKTKNGKIGILTGMCTKCYRLRRFKTEFLPVDHEEIPWRIKGTKPCECGNNRFVTLDDHIAETISLLNRKGYLTYFCCEGHPVKDGVSPEEHAGYVFFQENITEVLSKHPLPESWYLETEHLRNEKFDNRTIRETIPKEGRYSTKKRIDDLYKWAVSLD